MSKSRKLQGAVERVLGAFEIVAGYGTKRRRPGGAPSSAQRRR